LKLLGRANNLIQLIDRRALFVHRKLGVTNCVNEQDVRDLKLDFLFNLCRHKESPEKPDHRHTRNHAAHRREQSLRKKSLAVV
jgi:hypothetical protein